jgi:hypothetical protein
MCCCPTSLLLLPSFPPPHLRRAAGPSEGGLGKGGQPGLRSLLSSLLADASRLSMRPLALSPVRTLLAMHSSSLFCSILPLLADLSSTRPSLSRNMRLLLLDCGSTIPCLCMPRCSLLLHCSVPTRAHAKLLNACVLLLRRSCLAGCCLLAIARRLSTSMSRLSLAVLLALKGLALQARHLLLPPRAPHCALQAAVLLRFSCPSQLKSG